MSDLLQQLWAGMAAKAQDDTQAAERQRRRDAKGRFANEGDTRGEFVIGLVTRHTAGDTPEDSGDLTERGALAANKPPEEAARIEHITGQE